MDIQTSLAFFLQLVFFVRWLTSAVAICFLEFVSGIQRDFSMAMVLSCVAQVAMLLLLSCIVRWLYYLFIFESHNQRALA